MKNRLLAITRESIPYIPELKKKLGNTNATILMQQIEYWFNKKNGKPFYKFLNKPTKKNGFYKDGDSWCEELIFSEKEFRTAFSRIGVPYRSKKAFKEVLEKGEDVFTTEEGLEMYYCSYHDKIKGITYYYRNDKKMDSFLDDLVKTEVIEEKEDGNPCKLPSGSYGDDQEEVTDPRKLPSVSYVTDEREDTELPEGKSHITEITTEITTGDKTSTYTEEVNLSAKDLLRVADYTSTDYEQGFQHDINFLQTIEREAAKDRKKLIGILTKSRKISIVDGEKVNWRRIKGWIIKEINGEGHDFKAPGEKNKAGSNPMGTRQGIRSTANHILDKYQSDDTKSPIEDFKAEVEGKYSEELIEEYTAKLRAHTIGKKVG